MEESTKKMSPTEEKSGSSSDERGDERMAMDLSNEDNTRFEQQSNINNINRTGSQLSILEKLAATNRLVQEQSRIITQRGMCVCVCLYLLVSSLFTFVYYLIAQRRGGYVCVCVCQSIGAGTEQDHHTKR